MNFVLFLDLLEISKISDGGSNDVILHHVSQAQCYEINVNLFHCALTERRGGGGGEEGPSTLLVSRWERWGTSYSYNLYTYANERP